MIENQFQAKVKSFRSDNGTEFVGNDCQQLFLSLGITHKKSCVYTPQQNGVVERKHRHLLEVARSLMFQANLPIKFWPYSLLTATHIINRLPSLVLDWKSPFKILYRKQPDFERLRPFGCLAYATNTSPQKDKFSSRAHKSVFLGYVTGQKGYRLYDLKSHTMFISRDVIFLEDQFPFSHIPNSPQEVPLPSVSVVEPTSSPLGSLSPSLTTSPISPAPTDFPPLPRRSTRSVTQPSWLSDFVTNNALVQLPTANATSPRLL